MATIESVTNRYEPPSCQRSLQAPKGLATAEEEATIHMGHRTIPMAQRSKERSATHTRPRDKFYAA